MQKYFRKAISFILSGALCLTTMLTGGVLASADSATYQITELEGKYKTQGRTALVDGALMLDWSASGVEFNVNCSGDISITVKATSLGTSDTGGLYFSVFVDGVMQYEDMRIPEDNSLTNWTSNSTNYPFHITATGETSFTIAEGLDAGEHTVAIYNQTEAYMGAFGVKSITLDGEFLTPPANNELYIEYVGDSITAAHGNIATGGDFNDALYADATRGWAYLASKMLGADWSVIARSGITAIDGIGWSGSGSVSMQDVYPYQRYYSDKSTLYGFEREPDVIVLGLGTNDAWCWDVENRGGPLTDEEKTAGFKEMLAQLRQYNPNSKIVWIYGMMSSGANEYILDAVSDMGGAFNGYYSLQLPADTSGGHGHPGLAVQTTYAENVSDFITRITTEPEQEGWEVPTEEPSYLGGGTETDPYMITNGTELYWAVTNENKDVYFKLANDIILNDITVAVSGTEVIVKDAEDNILTDYSALKEWNTKGSSTPRFKGIIDGNGHIIRGLFIDHEYTGTNDVWKETFALVALSGNARIRNLGIEDSYISAVGGTAAGFIGNSHDNNSSIENCYLGDSVYIYGTQAGGFIGSGTSAKITDGINNCYSLATINSVDGKYVGAVYGGVWGSVSPVINCYANMKLYGNHGAAYSNCFSTATDADGVTILSTANMQGTAAQLNMSSLSDAFCITDSGYPTLRLFEGRTNGEWSGFRDSSLSGEGTEASPWLITSAEELAHVIYTGGTADKYYRLTADIYLNDTQKIDWTTGTVHAGYTPIGWYGSTFKANFDGDGHVVHGLYVVETVNTAEWKGTGDALFPAMSSGSIRNVGVDNSYVQATNNASAIVGYAHNSVQGYIKNCYAGANVTLKGYNAGGIYGSGDANMTIESCYSLAKVSGTHKYGGISGGWWKCTFSDGTVTYHYVSDCYTTSDKVVHSATSTTDVISGATAKGDAAINSYTSLSDAFVRIGNSYPTLRVFTDISENAPWDGFGDTSYIVDGAGDSADNPYIIENAGQLAHAIYNNGGGKYYKLANDIYVNDISGEWLDKENLLWLQPTAQNKYGSGNTAFTGHIDGNGYTVQGIYYPLDSTAKTAALVPVFGSGSIKDIGVRNSQIVSLTNAGGIVAITQWTNAKAVDSCFVDETVYIEFNDSSKPGGAGGIIGYTAVGHKDNPIKISNCYSAATLVSAFAANERSNGIVGISWDAYYTVENCYSIGYKPYHASGSSTASLVESNAYTNVYTDSTVAPSLGAYTQLDTDVIKSEAALNSMTGLSDDIWYAVAGGGKSPMLRSYGTAIGDVDENGAFELSGDSAALRQSIIGAAAWKNSDTDKNGISDICDLVSLHLK